MSVGYLKKCAGKRRHPTRAEAEKHRKAMVAQGMWRMSSSNTYGCNVCGGFHAGRMGSSNRGNGSGRGRK